MNGDLGAGSDSSSYLTLKSYDAVSNGAVTLFENSDCSGLSTRIYRNSKKDEDARLI